MRLGVGSKSSSDVRRSPHVWGASSAPGQRLLTKHLLQIIKGFLCQGLEIFSLFREQMAVVFDSDRIDGGEEVSYRFMQISKNSSMLCLFFHDFYVFLMV